MRLGEIRHQERAHWGKPLEGLNVTPIRVEDLTDLHGSALHGRAGGAGRGHGALLAGTVRGSRRD